MSRNTTINLQGWRGRLQASLAESDVDQPDNTSLLLLAAALDRPKGWVLTHNDYTPSPQESEKIAALEKQASQGRPLPYILGWWEFFGRRFKVTADVLIPRPETESLVEIALEYAKMIQRPTIIDVGTGSGAIAVSLAADLPDAAVYASDISWAALKIARENAQRLGQAAIHFLQGNLLTPLAAQFDLICANLPYIPTRKLRQLKVARWEPRLALDGGESGLDTIKTLLAQARTRLAHKGLLLLEIEANLGPAALKAAKSAFPKAQIHLVQDLAGLDRIIEIQIG